MVASQARPAYIYDTTLGDWVPMSGVVDTGQAYTFTANQTFDGGINAATTLNLQTGGTTRLSLDSSGRMSNSFQPSFLVYTGNGTAQAYHPSGWADISRFPTSGGVATAVANHNIGSHWNSSTGRFTAPVSGKYLFYAGGWASYNGAGNRYAVCFNINGGSDTYISGANTSITDTPVAVSSIVHNLSAGDYITARMFSAVAMNLGGGHVFYYGGYLLA